MDTQNTGRQGIRYNQGKKKDDGTGKWIQGLPLPAPRKHGGGGGEGIVIAQL